MRTDVYAQSLFKLIDEICPNPTAGAEIGVWKAGLSSRICNKYPKCLLYMVDCWQEWPPDSEHYKQHKSMGRETQTQWDLIYEDAMQNIRRSNGRYVVIKGKSEDATQYVADNSLDFVFIDAGHTYNALKQDLDLWIPKVKTGGLLSGHDYRGVLDRTNGYGISRAVWERFGQENVKQSDGHVWSTVKK